MDNNYYIPAIKIEKWKDVKNYEELYEISDKGQVRRKNKNNVLKQSNSVYRSVTLCKNNIKTNFTIHRLVAEAFISNPDNKEFVNHIDGNKYNNKNYNLEWCTRLENSKHASQNGLVRNQYGKNNNMNILNENEVKDIKLKIKSGITAYKVHKQFYSHLHQQTIYSIKQEKIWNQIIV